MKVVICGAGVIGASIAYYLAQRGVYATVVERNEVACAASGKSGGFIAKDWCDGQPQQELARLSFDLHAQLAEQFTREHGVDYGYRRMQTLSVASSELRDVSSYGAMTPPAWLSDECAVGGMIGNEQTTAQIHPQQFTAAMMSAAVNAGATLRYGRVDGLLHSADSSQVRGVCVDGETQHADAVVIAMGPWSQLFRETLALPDIVASKGYSIILKPNVPIPAQALFVEYECADGQRPSPEIVPRPDGSLWLCGVPSDDPLPLDPRDISLDGAAFDELQRIATRLCPALEGAERLASNACYRPICADAMPLIGATPQLAGTFIASAHNCWGMLNAPATGLVMSELLLDGAAQSIDLSPFNPNRSHLH